MGPEKVNTTTNLSWTNRKEMEVDQTSDWLSLYRKNLSWIKSSNTEEDDNLLKELVSEL
jgi:hypothetical protein